MLAKKFIKVTLTLGVSAFMFVGAAQAVDADEIGFEKEELREVLSALARDCKPNKILKAYDKALKSERALDKFYEQLNRCGASIADADTVINQTDGGGDDEEGDEGDFEDGDDAPGSGFAARAAAAEIEIQDLGILRVFKIPT
jgi:hypothetical protein